MAKKKQSTTKQRTFREWVDSGGGEGLTYGEQVKKWLAENFPNSEYFFERCDRWDRRDKLTETLSGAQWALIRHYIAEPTSDRQNPFENPLGFISSTCFFMDPLCRIAEGIYWGRLQQTFNENSLLKFCIEENIGLTDRAFELAREHKLFNATKRTPKKPEGEKTRAGRKGYDQKTRKRDSEIYNALKSGATYEGLMDRLNMKKSELIKARGREDKRRKKQAE
jgi:hypothetical protein